MPGGPFSFARIMLPLEARVPHWAAMSTTTTGVHMKRFHAVSAAAVLTIPLLLAACGGEKAATPSADPCTPITASDIEQFNYTFDLYEKGASVASGFKANVNLDGPGTLPISMLYAVTIEPSGEVGLFGALTGADGSQLEAGLPLNDVAKRSWPDAVATNGQAAVAAAASSSEASALLACK